MIDSPDIVLAKSSENRKIVPRMFTIANPNPLSMYLEILRQADSGDMVTQMFGEVIGATKSTNPESPMKEIESKIRGNTLGDSRKEFDFETNFELKKHTYCDEATAKVMEARLKNEGYIATMEIEPNGNKKLRVSSSTGDFDISLGVSNADENIRNMEDMMQSSNKKDTWMINIYKEAIERIKKNDESVRLHIQTHKPKTKDPSAGIVLKSEHQAIGYLEEGRNLAEIVGSVIMEELGDKKKTEPLKMAWESQKTASAIWHEDMRIYKPEDLLQIPLRDINNSLIRAIQVLNGKVNCPDLTDGKAMKGDIVQLLRIVELYFEKHHTTKPLVIESLQDNEKALLSLGLALKSVEKAEFHKDNRFTTLLDNPTIGGISFQRFGESKRDRFKFYHEQDLKYRYNRDSSEVADFFLQHTTQEGQTDNLTKYEKVQSEGLVKARKWIKTVLEPTKLGKYTAEDVWQINSLLLEGIVPSRALGAVRNMGREVRGRFGMTAFSEIETNLALLLQDVNTYISEGVDSNLENAVSKISQFWASFDGIHPILEGNGRTGTLLFESWLRLKTGKDYELISKRGESDNLARAMTIALSGDNEVKFIYPKMLSRISPSSFDPLKRFNMSHIQEVV